MSDETSLRSRRDALKCMAYGGAGTYHFTCAIRPRMVGTIIVR